MPSPASDSRSVAGGTTVVGGEPSTSGREFGTHFDGFGPGHIPNGKPRREASGKGGPVKSSEPFVIASDYMDESRPFFVKIGKTGVIGALQKLDGQLQNVSGHLSQHEIYMKITMG